MNIPIKKGCWLVLARVPNFGRIRRFRRRIANLFERMEYLHRGLVIRGFYIGIKTIATDKVALVENKIIITGGNTS